MDLDVTLFAQFAILCVFIVVTGQLILKPFLKITQHREQSLFGVKHESEQRLATLAEQEEQIRSTIESIRKEAMAGRAQLLQASREEEKQLLEKAKSQADARMDEIRAKLAIDRLNTQKQLETQARVLADRVSQQILGTEGAAR